MARADHRPSTQRYIKRQIVMLPIFFQYGNFRHNPLFLKQLSLSVGQAKFPNNYKQIGLLAT